MGEGRSEMGDSQILYTEMCDYQIELTACQSTEIHAPTVENLRQILLKGWQLHAFNP